MVVKKLLWSLAGILVVVAAVAVARALTVPSLQERGASQEADPVVGDLDGAAERFAGALRFPTISMAEVAPDTATFLGLHDYLTATYPRVHGTLSREVVSGLSLLYEWTGSDPSLKPMLLMGHLDVVPPIPGTEAEWTHPPFEGRIADGFVWGRGAMDDKVSVISILEAIEGLLADGFAPRRTLYLAFGHDEEVGGGQGARAIATHLDEEGVSDYALVVDEGGAIVEGPGGHSSTPPAHTNIGVLSAAISRLENRPFPARFGGASREMFRFLTPEMPFGLRLAFSNLWLTRGLVTRLLVRAPQTGAMVRTTTAVTIIEGGVKDNVLPIEARAVVNHRILPGESVESVVERVRSVIDDERVQVSIYAGMSQEPSPVSSTGTWGFRTVERSLRQGVPEPDLEVAPYLVIAGTDAKYYGTRSESVYRFLPARMEADALERIHGTNERLEISNLELSIRFFQQLIRNAQSD